MSGMKDVYYDIAIDGDFDFFKKAGVRATFHRVPIQFLGKFREVYKGVFKIRYRGPRFNVPSARYRTPMSKATTCLKRDATHFSAYYY